MKGRLGQAARARGAALKPGTDSRGMWSHVTLRAHPPEVCVRKMALATVVWLGNVVPRVSYYSSAGGEEGAVSLAVVRGKQDKTTWETFWSRWKRHPDRTAGKEAQTARADSALPRRI